MYKRAVFFFDNKGLKEEDKKEGFLKKLKDIEDKGEEQLKTIKSKNKNIKKSQILSMNL